MSLSLSLPAFTEELVKLALKLNIRGKAEVKAEEHFSTSDPNWKRFEKNLDSKHFREVVGKHPQADDKLRRYVKNYGGYRASQDVVGEVPSASSAKSYKLKKVGKRVACGCKDWQYRKSHGGGDCKHLKAWKAEQKTAGLAKTAFLRDVAKAVGPLAWNQRRAANQVQLARASALAAQMREQEEFTKRQAKG